MRFICPEIVKQTKFALPSVFDLFKVSGEYTDLLDGALQRVYYTFKDELKNYYYGKATLYKYLSAITESTTPMTIAEYAIYAGIGITDNLGATVEAMDCYFQEAELLKLKTEMWLTIFGENGMYFYKPERLATSQQITNFTIIEQITQETNDYGFFGETGYNLSASVLAGDTVNIATIGDDLKTLICNCNRACADILVISSAQDADPLAYICDMKLTAGKVYLAVSKREVEGGFQYTMVKESKATFTFAQGDVTNPNVSSGSSGVSSFNGRTGDVSPQAGDYDASDVGLGNVSNVAQLPASYLDTDGTLAANSDTKVASQKAAKTYADTKLDWLTSQIFN